MKSNLINNIIQQIKENNKILDLSQDSSTPIDPLVFPKNLGIDCLVKEKNKLRNPRFFDTVFEADIENIDISKIINPNKYDFIFLPANLHSSLNFEKIFQELNALLAPQGQLILSAPNASFIGEIFPRLYRSSEELISVSTYDKKSLLNFFASQGWSVHSMQANRISVTGNDFKNYEAENMPPSVLHYILSQEDALTHDFIFSLTPTPHHSSQQNTAILSTALSTPEVNFSSAIYWGDDHNYSVSQQVVQRAVIGKSHQRIFFEIPPFNTDIPTLRWYPADRPGFMHLHELILKTTEGHVLWNWSSPRSLSDADQLHIAIQDTFRTALGSTLMLLTQSDAWINLPIPHDFLRRRVGNSPVILEVQIGWPMSADYLQMASHVDNLHSEKKHLEQTYLAQKKHIEQSYLNHNKALAEHKAVISDISESNAEFRKIRDIHESMINALNQKISDQNKNIQQLDNDILQITTSGSYKLARKISSVRKIFKFNQTIKNKEENTDKYFDENVSEEIDLQNQKSEFSQSKEPCITQEEEQTPKLVELNNRIFDQKPITDIIIPVYKGITETKACVESILASTLEPSSYNIIIINDCSPEPAITSWLQDLARKNNHITLIENTENLGFVGTVNVGMKLNPAHDVLLLNSDTQVANNWLFKLKQHAYSASNIGSVTPLSNNATICSYPQFCQSNLLPDSLETSAVDAICAQVNPHAAVSIPTAVGFCMFIRRDCLDEIGFFDEAHFGKGYGEENDFCMRAHDKGWKHLLAVDTFVFHSGGVSFGTSKSPREQAAYAVLTKLHPQYEALVRQHVAEDPAKSARNNVDKYRLQHSKKPCILMVTHSIGGGTQRHVMELVKHFDSAVNCLQLCPLPNNFVRLKWLNTGQAYEEDFYWPSESKKIIQLLKDISVAHIHFHHLLGIHPSIMELPTHLGVAYDFTAHDYYTCCPQIFLTLENNNYCGEQGIQQCQNCVQHRPTPTGEGIQDWRLRHRLFLNQARYVLAPSLDIASRMRKYFPDAPVRFVPHLDIPQISALPQPQGKPISAHANLRIFILGGVNAAKGAFLMEAVARLAAQYDAPLELHLIGYPHLPLQCQPQASLTIHGGYAEHELPVLLQRLKPDLIWFPALWPETYSYTLSAALELGLPVVAPDLGAFSERLHQRAWTWLQPWNTDADAWVTFFTKIRQSHFIDNAAPIVALSHNPSVSSATFPAWNYDEDYFDIAHRSN